MNANKNVGAPVMTKDEIMGVIGDHATFAKKDKLERMVLSKKGEYLMVGMRVYIVVILSLIILSLLKII
jgi:hypothetical protein